MQRNNSKLHFTVLNPLRQVPQDEPRWEGSIINRLDLAQLRKRQPSNMEEPKRDEMIHMKQLKAADANIKKLEINLQGFRVWVCDIEMMEVPYRVHKMSDHVESAVLSELNSGKVKERYHVNALTLFLEGKDIGRPAGEWKTVAELNEQTRRDIGKYMTERSK